MPKTLTDEQHQMIVTALAQADYAFYHGDRGCSEAAVRNVAEALRMLGEKTAAEEAEEEDDDAEDDA